MYTGYRDRHRRSVTAVMYVYVAFLVKRLYGRSGVSGGVYSMVMLIISLFNKEI